MIIGEGIGKDKRIIWAGMVKLMYYFYDVYQRTDC